jgi:MFS family permease
MLTLAALFAIRLTPGIAFEAVAVAAPAMRRGLGLDHAQIGLVLGAFMLPGIVATVLAGLLAQRIGDRAVLWGGLALITLGAAGAAEAGSYAELLAARLLGGVGGVSVLMLILKMVTDRFAGRWLSTASAVTITSWPAGLGLGLLSLGALPARLGWRATVGLAGAPALAALLLVPLVGGGAARRGAVAAAAPEGARPSLALVTGAVASWGCINGTLAVCVGFLPAYLVSLGRSVPAASAATSLFVWSFAVLIPCGGLLADRLIGRRACVLASLVLTPAVLAAIAMSGAPAVLLLTLGLVFSAAPGPLTAQLGEATPAAARAIVFGWYTAGSYGAMTVAPWIAGWLHDLSGDPRAPLLFAAALGLSALIPYAVMERAGRAG